MGRKLKEQEDIVKQLTEEMEAKQKTLQEKESMIESLQQKLKDKGNESVGGNESEEKECGICFEPFTADFRAMCFVPCGHARTCRGCYQSLPNPKKCPECRVKIQKAVVLFY